MTNISKLHLKNDLGEIARLGDEIAAFAGSHPTPLSVIHSMNLALEELVTNIISYGYDDEHEHVIGIELALQPDSLRARIEDDGTPFNPMESRRPDIDLPLEERPIGGLGILLVSRLMDEIAYERRDGKNVLTIAKRMYSDTSESYSEAV
jgi:serine/threonine-protein kinase RsbW